MEKFVKFATKLLEKFVYNLQNYNFAGRIKHNALVFDKNLEESVRKAMLSYKRIVKYSNGRIRVKNFLINNLDTFEREHKVIVKLIETHDVRDKWDDYVRSKSCIAAILRANRRMGLLKMTDNDDVKSYINQHITYRRFGQRTYKLAT